MRDRWTVKIKGGRDLDVKGNILDHEYTIGEGRDKVAEGQNDVLILAIVVAVDMMR